MRLPTMFRFAAIGALCAALAAGQTKTTFESLPGIVLSNDKLAVTILPEGGAMVEALLAGDAGKTNPLWDPLRMAREAGQPRPNNFYRGHFICVDGFGPVSAAERAAGLPMHGEAHTLPWNLDSYEKRDGAASAKFSVKLPLSHESLTRTYRMADGENVIWIDSELENLLAFDRPAFWGEHATIGGPFLEPGKVAVDMPVTRSKTKAYPAAARDRRLEPLKEFTWPAGPTVDGRGFDMRTAPMIERENEHSTSLIDPARKLGFVTALRLDNGLLIGWVFRRAEFPWVQTWLANPGPNRMARGLEFATQPFDLPRADVLQAGPLFDTPVFRILPAKSKIASSFLMFYTRVPDGFRKVDDVRFDGGKLVIEDRGAGKTVTLAVSRSL